jgi:hypothetical protein
MQPRHVVEGGGDVGVGGGGGAGGGIGTVTLVTPLYVSKEKLGISRGPNWAQSVLSSPNPQRCRGWPWSSR